MSLARAAAALLAALALVSLGACDKLLPGTKRTFNAIARSSRASAPRAMLTRRAAGSGPP